MDVKEYDQVNLICPVSKPGTLYPETHVIYSVSRDEFDSCRITNPKPRIVAICNKPHTLMYFTITFRSFTPTPGGLEFHPGQDYYFISTSSRDDLHRRVGGGCSTHNMKMIFKVEETEEQKQERLLLNAPRLNLLPKPSTTQKAPQSRPQQADNDYVYYYHPRDVIALENAISGRRDESLSSSSFSDRRRIQSSHLDYLNEVDSLKYTSSGATVSSLLFMTLCSLSATLRNLG